MSFRLVFQVHLTDDCGQGCRHCYNTAGATYLTSEQFDYLLDQACGYMNSSALVPGTAIFCGGEPTRSPILAECVSKCARAGFRQVLLLTNGAAIDHALAARLRQAGLSGAQICIEGNEDTHNEIRNGTWKQVLQAWAICRGAGLRVTSQTTIHPLNYRQADAVVRACQGNTDAVTFLRHIPYDRQLGVLSAGQWVEFLAEIFTSYYAQWRPDEPFVSVSDVQWSHHFMNGAYLCGYLSRYPTALIFECNGDVYACRRSGIVLGNTFRQPLADVLAESAVLDAMQTRTTLNTTCRSCIRAEACAGCRGMALAVHGHVMAEDPQCAADHLEPDLRHVIVERQRRSLPASFAGDPDGPEWASALRVADSLRRFGAAPATAVETERIRWSGLEGGVTVSTAELQSAADAIRCLCGLERARDAEEWFRSVGLTSRIFGDYLAIALIRQKMTCRASAASQRLAIPR